MSSGILIVFIITEPQGELLRFVFLLDVSLWPTSGHTESCLFSPHPLCLSCAIKTALPIFIIGNPLNRALVCKVDHTDDLMVETKEMVTLCHRSPHFKMSPGTSIPKTLFLCFSICFPLCPLLTQPSSPLALLHLPNHTPHGKPNALLRSPCRIIYKCFSLLHKA